MATEFHSEHVGSLLRPPELLEARAAYGRGELTLDRLREIEDGAVLDAVRLQREAGVEVYTDGEMRRTNWMAGILEAVGGTVPVPTPGAAWTRNGGEPPHEETDFEMVAARDRLTQKLPLTEIEAAYLAKHAPGPYKITMMSASMGQLLWREGVSDPVYATPQDVVADLKDLQIAEIGRLIDAGVRRVQLDSLGYNSVIDPEFRAGIGLGDVPPGAILEAALAVDREIVRAAHEKMPEVVVGMHFCRGNNRSAWMSSGGYEPIAERLFAEVGVDRLLLEYDTDRAGGFEPLRFVRPGTTVVLGLVSSKTPVLEDPDDLRRRIDEAAEYVPIDDLALSPQCGFASTAPGNLLTPDDQRRKLELVTTTATHIWG